MNSLYKHAHWFLRIGLSSVFLYHGLNKLPNITNLSTMMGIPSYVVLLIAGAEILGAIFILIGGFTSSGITRFGGLLLAPVMIGAIFMVHLQYGWNSVNIGSGNMGRGMEFQFVLLMTSLYFLFNGNGTRDSKTSFINIEASKDVREKTYTR